MNSVVPVDLPCGRRRAVRRLKDQIHKNHEAIEPTGRVQGCHIPLRDLDSFGSTGASPL